MAPPRKPIGQRVRRNVQPAKVGLPAEGYRGPLPDWPFDNCTVPEFERWRLLWRTPMAAQWARLRIETVVARYVRIALLAESSEHYTSVAMSNVKGEARQLESQLGLSPKAMQMLNWEIVEDELDEGGPSVAAPVSEGRRHLKAVDRDAG